MQTFLGIKKEHIRRCALFGCKLEMLISDSVYLLRLKPTRTFRYHKIYPLAIFQRTIATALDGTIMNEDVTTCVPLNKAKTFVIIEPFHST